MPKCNRATVGREQDPDIAMSAFKDATAWHVDGLHRLELRMLRRNGTCANYSHWMLAQLGGQSNRSLVNECSAPTLGRKLKLKRPPWFKTSGGQALPAARQYG